MTQDTTGRMLDGNERYWAQGYHSPNVDSYVFRLHGRILKPDYGLPRRNPPTRLLDFGSGQGAAVDFFARQGFDAYGVDGNGEDVGRAKATFPQIAARFATIPTDTREIDDLGAVFGLEGVEVVTSFQTLYYLPKAQFEHALRLFHALLPPGGLFFATMMSRQHELFYDNSEPVPGGDGWMRSVAFETSRQRVSDYFMHFVEDERDLVAKFAPFRPVHIGEYMNRFHSEDGSGHHYTFFGVKE